MQIILNVNIFIQTYHSNYKHYSINLIAISFIVYDLSQISQ